MQKTIEDDELLDDRKKNSFMVFFALLLCVAVVPSSVVASTTGVEFQAVYDFVFNAANGYLGRAIAIVGGLIGMGVAAASGRAVLAVLGIVLAIFGALGPAIINSIFGSALIF